MLENYNSDEIRCSTGITVFIFIEFNSVGKNTLLVGRFDIQPSFHTHENFISKDFIENE